MDMVDLFLSGSKSMTIFLLLFFAEGINKIHEIHHPHCFVKNRKIPMILLNLAQEKGLNPKFVATTAGGEYHSSCPVCGGRDRFVIQPNKQMRNCMGSYFCRQCDTKGDSIQFCRDHLGYDFKDAMDRVGAQMPDKTFPVFTQKKNSATAIALTKPSNVWAEMAEKLVSNAHEKMLSQNRILDALNQRGLSIGAIKQYRLGWIEKDERIEGCLWGEKKETIWLPAGILIPTIEKDQSIIRLKIRRRDWKPGDEYPPKYIAVTGSMRGLNIIGDKKNPIMIVVESELDAYALHSTVGDFAIIVAVGGGMKDIDSTTNYLAQKKAALLICHDNDETGNKMFNKWLTNYPHAKSYPTPMGKDIGEAIKQGLQLRDWIVDALPHELKCSLRLVWNDEEQALMDWILCYINERTTITRDSYKMFEEEIKLGPSSPRAISGELQDGLRLMKRLIEEQENKGLV